MNRKHIAVSFDDNAGIIRLDDKTCAAIKVETHNHPSAVDPYDGAATGAGGVIRDILACGLGSRPAAAIDVFCTGYDKSILKKLADGVGDYNNRMGIPTIGGAVYEHSGYRRNPLVFCGTIGIISSSDITKTVNINDRLVLVGGKTGIDGLHGAAFASRSIDGRYDRVNVQLGDPVTGKTLTDAHLAAVSKKLFSSVNDCGAGGISSAAGELVSGYGAEINLDDVPLKHKGLSGWEILLSESQERMVYAVRPSGSDRFIKHMKRYGLQASDIGFVSGTGKIRIFFAKRKIADIETGFLYKGPLLKEKHGIWYTGRKTKPAGNRGFSKKELTGLLYSVLSHPSVVSREETVRQYDMEVQGSTVRKPYAGKNQGIPCDGFSILPFETKGTAVSVGIGLGSRLESQDPYRLSVYCCLEAAANTICAGGDMDRAAFVDNFCLGDAENDPEEMGKLILMTEGCRDAALHTGIPFITGKDSLNNCYEIAGKKKKVAVPATLLVTCIAPALNYHRLLPSAFTGSGNTIYLIGPAVSCTAGSAAEEIFGKIAADPGQYTISYDKNIPRYLERVILNRLVLSCRDISDGGIAAALSEMTLNGIGGTVNITEKMITAATPSAIRRAAAAFLFSEEPMRFIVEVDPKAEQRFIKYAGRTDIYELGITTDEKKLEINAGAKTLIKASIDSIEEAYRGCSGKRTRARSALKCRGINRNRRW